MMNEPTVKIPLMHPEVNRLKYQKPKPFYVTYAPKRQQAKRKTARRKKDWTLLLMIRVPFLALITLFVLMIWLLPLDLYGIYRLVFTVLLVLISYGLILSLEMLFARQETPSHLMTERVPAIGRSGNSMKRITQDLSEDTEVFLERVTR